MADIVMVCPDLDRRIHEDAPKKKVGFCRKTEGRFSALAVKLENISKIPIKYL